MNDRSSRRKGGIRQVPLDHLRPGSTPPTAAGSGPPDALLDEDQRAPEPAEEGSSGTDDLIRGRATRSPAAVATRRHLEGSEQGPQ
jgi:hypothetical protein